MKTKLLLGTGILLLGLTSCSYFTPEAVDTNIISEKSGYDMYDMNKLSQEKVNILQFHAEWCPSCRSLEKDILANTIPENINILKVDYDNSADLKEKYGVTMQHTSVQVDGNGEMIKKWSKSATLDALMKEVEMIKTPKMEDKAMMQDDTMMEDKTSDMEKAPALTEEKMPEETMKNDEMVKEETMVKTGMYSDYSADKLSATDKNVLFFHASWCPACRWADKNFANSEIPENVNLLKVDYDNSADLKEKYGVTMQHTYVLVDSKWEMIKKWSGSNDVKDLEMRAWE